ncbi:hypothetical protein [Desulfovibrio legallii]|jgi:hypothetical protein|uniref:DUF3299 domain-containing protein n=1 Tax=Desulfovibrio legallii TaxID=571438 RepID=A0A1G7JWP0_9BACT|nr:hypothetical protein [Desulfovibrio legallii]SDF29367.1 hypothetical protein SAMN05192586_103170 [Desulfovibrio legallii]
MRAALFSPALSRRLALLLMALGLCMSAPDANAAGPTDLGFNEMYAAQGVLGMQFSAKLLALNGKPVRIKGFMAPPLKADGVFFVLTSAPVALCPFCNAEADWPADIVVAYMAPGERFVQNNAPIAATGILEVGAATDPETGFVSMVRLRETRICKL